MSTISGLTPSMEGQLSARLIQIAVDTGATLGQLDGRVHDPLRGHQLQMASPEVKQSKQ